jgi:GNAT superfamily N-acetyltransferase
VVGNLVARDAETLTLDTRRGRAVVERRLVVAAKEVPPPPSRRGAPHLALSIEDLQRVMALAWGAAEREQLGDWTLRASSGFTQRGNSAVPVGSPGLPLAKAVDRVEEWYAVRGLPAKFALAGPEGFDPAADSLGAELSSRGYVTGSRTLALTAAVATLVEHDPGGPAAIVSETLDPEWLDTYQRTRSTVPEVTERVLTGSPRQLFGHVRPGGGLSQQLGLRAPDAAGTAPIALARLGIGGGWAGLGAVWTDPAYRGRGLAAHLTAELARAARADGIRLMHLQVEQDNHVALRLYGRLGFQRHSAYAYLTQPKPR